AVQVLRDVDQRQSSRFGFAIDEVRHFNHTGELDSLVTHIEDVKWREATLHRQDQTGHSQVRRRSGMLALRALDDRQKRRVDDLSREPRWTGEEDLIEGRALANRM